MPTVLTMKFTINFLGYEQRLNIPMHFARSLLGEESKDVWMFAPGSIRGWSVRYITYTRKGSMWRARFENGWHQFVKENEL
ncbi:hypothetical protein JCGZ_16144 [Jatropha curcas]|uniref:TF-B3 domain-containing protein n=1 Tax=Jatropha curcas TaxID=180498 RepID=A0A067K3S9_JATCU|nr:hypothetical protein JCGZ_16144 [Jatropha curcas]